MAEKTNKQNGFLNFVKRNLALIIIIACVLAIVTIVVVESTKPSDPIVDVGGGDTDNDNDNDNDRRYRPYRMGTPSCGIHNFDGLHRGRRLCLLGHYGRVDNPQGH